MICSRRGFAPAPVQTGGPATVSKIIRRREKSELFGPGPAARPPVARHQCKKARRIPLPTSFFAFLRQPPCSCPG